MTDTVIVMPTAAGDRYTARLGAPHNLQTEGATADSAFAALEAKVRAMGSSGLSLVRVDVPRYDRLFEVVGGLDQTLPPGNSGPRRLKNTVASAMPRTPRPLSRGAAREPVPA
jgi:hypothetical protein